MSKRKAIILSVVIEGRSQADTARHYEVSESWVSTLVARYRTEGNAAFEARSRRPNTSPSRTAEPTVSVICDLRAELTRQGLDAGPETIRWHLQQQGIDPVPTWQTDMCHWKLANGTDTEILSWIDDHSRYALSVTAHRRVNAAIVVETFYKACDINGFPASVLSDNGMYFTARFARGGHSGPNHLQTVSPDRRVHQQLQQSPTPPVTRPDHPPHRIQPTPQNRTRHRDPHPPPRAPRPR